MENKKNQLIFLSAMVLIAFLLVFFIFKPFLYVLILAIIFAVAFQTPYQKILSFTRQRRTIAALITTSIVFLFILIPLVFLGKQIIQEGQQIYFSLTENSTKDAIVLSVKMITENVQKYFPGTENLSINLDQYLKQGLSWLLENLGNIFSNITKTLANSFIFLVAFYFLLKDGPALKKYIINLSPLSSATNEKIVNKIGLDINSAIRGNFIIVLIQGILTSIGFSIFGVPNAVLWGVMASIAAFIPGIGTSLVIIPAILYLFFIDKIGPAIGLTIWGIVAVGLIDNFLAPKLVGRGMRLHPLLVIVAVLGGAVFFGPIGFILGPLAVSLFLSLLDIYSYLSKKTE